MSKRTKKNNEDMTGDNANPQKDVGVAALGHAGHVIRVYADYAIWCETDNAFLPNTSLTSGKLPGV